MNSVKTILRRTFGGCSKSKTCNYYNTESETCLYGPYTYCGKYRTTIKSRNKKMKIAQ
jgi:hypothetical protein